MNYKSMVLKGVLFILFYLIIINNAQGNPMTQLENLAKNALLEERNDLKNDNFKIRQIKVSYFNNINVFEIQAFGAEDPPPVFLIIIDCKKKIHIFEDSISIKSFNRFISENQITIDKNNLTDFIDIFLYLVDSASKIISSYDDFDYLSDVFIEEKGKIGPITPLKFEIGKNDITVDFFSWAETSSLKKWNITISLKGKILNSNFKELYVIAR